MYASFMSKIVAQVPTMDEFVKLLSAYITEYPQVFAEYIILEGNGKVAKGSELIEKIKVLIPS